MKSRLILWDSPEVAKKELKRRLDGAIRCHKKWKEQWHKNEAAVYGRDLNEIGYTWESDVELNNLTEPNWVEINHVFRHVRLIHAQLSANPPTTMARPATSDSDDRKKAEAADKLLRHALRQYRLQEKVDQSALSTVIRGNGVMKTVFNCNAGDIIGYDQETGEIETAGDIEIKPISPRLLKVDPDARSVEEIRYVFEEILLPYEEACYRWPDAAELLKKALADAKSARLEDDQDTHNTTLVSIYEYYETGLPVNAMAGRHCYCTRDGDLLSKVEPNPFAFAPPVDKHEKRRRARAEATGRAYTSPPPTARLPYHFFTDIDMPDEVWGRSFVEYELSIQDVMNRIDNMTMENVKTWGNVKCLVPDTAELGQDDMTDDTVQLIKVAGLRDPHPMPPPGQMPDMIVFRDRLERGGESIAGVNDAMFGQTKREQSGLVMQYSVNQGNMIRRRLFNKYVLFVEAIYRAYLNLIVKHWTEERTITVLGKEKAFETVDIKGADIDGGFDLVVEYGSSLSLDPQSRREEIITLLPILEKAEIDPKIILNMLKLGELETIHDINKLAEERQREIFETMIATGEYIEPRQIAEHAGMLKYAYMYVMSAEFRDLPEGVKALIEQHILARERVAAMGATPTAPLPPGPMGTDVALPPVPAAPGVGGAAPIGASIPAAGVA